MARRFGTQLTLTFALVGLVLSAGCGNSEVAETKSDQPAASDAKQTREPFVPLDACTLLTKADVEQLTGKTVLEPQSEALSNLSTCSFGDPAAPKVAGRPLSQVVSLEVFTGEEGAYYAGAAAQAKDSFESARKNAASTEAVTGLGEGAFWDKTFHSLWVYKGKYFLTATVESGDLDLARKVATKAMTRLP